MSRPLASTHPLVLAVLLDALADQSPAPRAPKWERESETGLTANTWRTCPACNGQTERRWKGRTVPCDRCKHQGGWWTDAMDTTGAQVVENSRDELTLAALTRTLCDLDLRQLERIRPDLDTVLGEKVRAMHPAYLAITAALIGMRQAAPYHHAVIGRRHFVGLPTPLSDIALYDDALLILGDTLGPAFRAPGFALKRAEDTLREHRAAKALEAQKSARWPDRDKRAAEARRLADQGRSVRWIAEHLGVSKSVIGRDIAA